MRLPRPAVRPALRRSRGLACEEAVAERLVAGGWRLRDRNFHVRGGELDLVIERDGVLAFVEIRSRTSDRFGTAAETVTPKKQRRVVLAARHWLARHGDGGLDVRFDVVTLRLVDGRIEAFAHLENAFFAGM